MVTKNGSKHLQQDPNAMETRSLVDATIEELETFLTREPSRPPSVRKPAGIEEELLRSSRQEEVTSNWGWEDLGISRGSKRSRVSGGAHSRPHEVGPEPAVDYLRTAGCWPAGSLDQRGGGAGLGPAWRRSQFADPKPSVTGIYDYESSTPLAPHESRGAWIQFPERSSDRTYQPLLLDRERGHRNVPFVEPDCSGRNVPASLPKRSERSLFPVHFSFYDRGCSD